MTDRLDAIRQRVEKATDGPWQVIEDRYEEQPERPDNKLVGKVAQRRIATVWHHGQLHAPQGVVNTYTTIGKVCGQSPHHGVTISEADADFIAHAREDVPFLLAELSTLRAMLETVTQERDDLKAERDERRAITDPWQRVAHLAPWQCVYGQFHEVEAVRAAREAERAKHGGAQLSEARTKQAEAEELALENGVGLAKERTRREQAEQVVQQLQRDLDSERERRTAAQEAITLTWEPRCDALQRQLDALRGAEATRVFTVETGEYEGRYLVGIYTSVAGAVAGIKATFGAPYVVWGELEHTPATDGMPERWWLRGAFEAVSGYSTNHIADFDIEPDVLQGPLLDALLAPPPPHRSSPDE